MWAPRIRLAAVPLCDGVAAALAALFLAPDWEAAAAYIVAVLAAINVTRGHRLRICLRVSDEIPRLVGCAALPIPVLLLWEPAGPALVGLGGLSAALLVTVRGCLYTALRSAHRRGRLVEAALVVGTGELAADIANLLLEHPELGLWPVGFIGGSSPSGCELPSLGRLPALPEVAARERAGRIIVCFHGGDAELVTVLRASRPMAAEICVVPRMFELAAAIPGGLLDDVWGIPLIPMRPGGIQGLQAVAKRAFDLVAGTVLLVVFTPVLLALLAAVLVRHGRPALFRQERVTRAGRLMRIAKFRTVTADNAGGQWVVDPDQCTALGRWLRATHLDELPQLFNVIRGEMSLVGPRPERPYFVSRFAEMIPRYEDRHRMHSGMTGWAQVHGLTGDTSIGERARFDNHYIEHWSLWLDMVILARTIIEPLTGALRRDPPPGGPPERGVAPPG